ncbi:MAG: fused response regulator/phosphatase [Magnetococcales bacterium]|nr:fused response regulator/phosphatase [Magnetococcales bacterium]
MTETQPKSQEPRILIVEDARMLAVALRRFIRALIGLPSDIAGTLHEALERIDANPQGYTLAILDPNLPDARHDQSLRAISGRGVASILFAEAYDESMRVALLNQHVIDFVVKNNPASLMAMLQLIRRILKNQSIEVLLVDDSKIARHLAAQMLHTYQFIVLEAECGEQAIDILEHQPDIRLVITDYYMPGMNGDELTARIRTFRRREEMAIIGLSSEDEPSLPARFLKSGANDFMRKPFLPEEFFCRITQNLEYLEQLEEIRKHRDLLSREREIIEVILTKMRASAHFDPYRLRYVIEPVERTYGDLLLAARRPDGAQHVMLGDFTGHGLQAALGGPMVTSLFYDMTAQNLPMTRIIDEINRKITISMPTDMFLAAGFVEIEPDRARMTTWNCSIPDILVYRDDRILERLHSENLPRGIRDMPVKPGRILHLQPGDRIFLFSDGIIEDKNPEEEPFDFQGLEAFLTRMLAEDLPLERILVTLEQHRQGQEQQDDITLAEVTC